MDLEEDSLPLHILPELKKKFPETEFEIKDPNEEWEIGESKELVILDTAIGIKDIKIFNNLDKFLPAPRMGMHDFDALANLKYLQKLDKIKKIKIIGVSSKMNEKEAIQKISQILNNISKK
jgi:hypothetical protein